jgi:hypothetical protein
MLPPKFREKIDTWFFQHGSMQNIFKLADKFIFPKQLNQNIFLQSVQSFYTILLPVLFFLLALVQAADKQRFTSLIKTEETHS